MIDKVLGQKIAAPLQYDKTILVREERQTNRTHIGLNDNNLPFIGFDIWNCYEISCLTDKGLPITGIIKIIYPADSKYIVESKSLKLYLNSFNMTKMGASMVEAYNYFIKLVIKDLTELLETKVSIGIFSANSGTGLDFLIEYNKEWLDDYEAWECLDICGSGSEFTVYKESPELLSEDPNLENLIIPQAFSSTLLRSNCKITHQQDIGDVYIYIKGVHPINKESLLKYIISFRGENHFHEEINECIYKRLWDRFKPLELLVYTPYCRRGGIDICPVRASHGELIPIELTSDLIPYIKTSRQ